MGYPSIARNYSLPITIACIHAILQFLDFPILRIDGYWQLPSKDCWYNHPLHALLLLNGTSPALALWHSAFTHLGNDDPYPLYAFILPMLHAIGCYLFLSILSSLRIRYRTIWAALFFLNPLAFAYFRYPFYSTYLFFLSLVLLYSLWVIKNRNRRLVSVSITIALAAAVRPSWHLGLAIFWVGWLAWNERKKLSRASIITAFLILLFPFGLYLKNLILFDSFSASTWLGMNLARSRLITLDSDERKNLASFQLPTILYRGIYSEDDPLVSRYSETICLNGDDYHNIRFIEVSRKYLSKVKETTDVRQSLRLLKFGIKVYLSSPSNYPFLVPQFSAVPEFLRKYPGLDWFAAVDMGSFDKNLYRIVYPISLLLLLLRFFSFSYKVQIIVLHTVSLTILYSFIDPFEANRMRFELEPFWYLCVLFSFIRIKAYVDRGIKTIRSGLSREN
ncbi:hypothetical protein LEP1GSC047_2211 [Leptospira inadai serovar Lyme str. 10]|uniref:Glycosyltransferase RgtA/B/C/D-like domain-containing protein n=2 Tax=Leptospira inadai serovar Lyme TaxID=293084 RepID=V6HFF4_9LEPT|nr:hypothetical protein [Leptospira inadai]EQA38363.1 hypothetical protein LEP1GSC047_2211 [Leptospira inadai serovar Lyme str. 10]PNV74266.1 hypothetical protein BES34_014780 [Leptospira inadai serovar Lyme]